MNAGEDYASDSESDEDFCVENEKADDSGSEEENDSEIDGADSSDAEEEAGRRPTKNKGTKATPSSIGKSTPSRKTRRTEGSESKLVAEKDALASDEEVDKSRSDALWSDFLSDVGSESRNSNPTANSKPAAAKDSDPKTRTEILDFAGEQVEVAVQKTVGSSSSAKENKKQPPILKRPANGVGGSGLGSLLNQLGKKKKMSVLEKSQMDWKSFKSDEGIDEELRTHNKGKDGYLERQDFLQRTDLRQFEIEKNLRQTRRQN